MSIGLRLTTAIVSVIMVLAGFYLFYDKDSMVMIFGAAAAFLGLALLIKYLIMGRDSRSVFDLIGGVINIIFGALMLLGGTETKIAGVIAVEFYIAVWVLIAGFSHISSSFAFKKAGFKGWIWTLLGGVFAIIAGAVFIILPMRGTTALVGFGVVFAGISLIILGATGLMGAVSPVKK